MKKILVILLISILSLPVFSQEAANLAKSNAIMADGNGNYAKAAELYANADKLYSEAGITDTFCIFKAGQNYVRIKQYNKGVEYLKKALDLNYVDKKLYLYLADGYNGLKKFAGAEKYYKEGIAKYPEVRDAYLKKLAYLYYNHKKYNEAVNTIDEALKSLPGNTKLLYIKANSLGKLKKYDDAVTIYQQILAAEPDNLKVKSKLGVIMFKKTEEAYKAEVKRYERLKNPDRIAYHNYRKNIERISTGYKKALPYLEKVRAANPKDKLVLNCLMVSYSRLGMKDKANEIKTLLGK